MAPNLEKEISRCQTIKVNILQLMRGDPVAEPEQRPWCDGCSWTVLMDAGEFIIKTVAFQSIFRGALYYLCGIAALSSDCSGDRFDWNTK